jgi:DNA-binding transcriptional LysR family regulator
VHYRNVKKCESGDLRRILSVRAAARTKAVPLFRFYPARPQREGTVLDHRVLQAQIYIAALAEEGSFSRAAKRLHTAQSFLTKKIAEVERNLRIKIFERSTRRLELTEVGHIVVPEIELALRHAERAWELGRYYSRLMRGPIRLGYSLYTHEPLLRVLHSLDLSQFEAQRIAPENAHEPRVVLEHSVTPDLIERVLRGRLHASLGILPIHNRELWIEPLVREPFCVCLSKGHALAQRQTLAARDLHGQAVFWIPREMHPAFYDRTVKYIESTGARPVYHEIGCPAHAIEIALHGLGIGLLPHSASRLSRPGVVFKTITDRSLQIETALFARRQLMRGVLQDFTLFLASRLQAVKPNVQ